MSNSEKGGPPPEDDRGPPSRRSRSRSPRRRSRRSSRSRSRSRSLSRSRSPAFRRRSRSPPRRRRGRSRSRSYSPGRGSRSRSPPWYGGRSNRDRGFRDRGPPGGPGYGPDYSREGHGRDYGPPGGPPPYGEPFDQYGPSGRGPRGGGGPPRRRGESRRRDEGPPGVSLLVRNVSPDITTSELKRAFGHIGEVRDVYIPRDFHSQQPKGFAFIEYATPRMAREARDEMHKFRIKGRELEVVFAQERRKTPNEMRGRVVNDSNRERGGSNFERSSSFERHRQRQREESRNGRGERSRGDRGREERRGQKEKDLKEKVKKEEVSLEASKENSDRKRGEIEVNGTGGIYD